MPRRMLFAAAALLLAACGEPTKEELIRDAAGVETKAALEQALGTPDDIVKLGPLEKWTYEAANGRVVFVITGDLVALEAATN